MTEKFQPSKELTAFLNEMNLDTSERVTPRDRAIWPEPEGVCLDDPVELHIKLERPVYEWMIKFLEAEYGNSSFFTF